MILSSKKKQRYNIVYLNSFACWAIILILGMKRSPSMSEARISNDTLVVGASREGGAR